MHLVFAWRVLLFLVAAAFECLIYSIELIFDCIEVSTYIMRTNNIIWFIWHLPPVLDKNKKRIGTRIQVSFTEMKQVEVALHLNSQIGSRMPFRTQHVFTIRLTLILVCTYIFRRKSQGLELSPAEADMHRAYRLKGFGVVFSWLSTNPASLKMQDLQC